MDAFKQKPVRFIAITDENEQVVEHFLKQTPIHSWVGLDGAGKSNRDVYNIQGIPTTVIVNSQGIVVAVTHPAKLQPKDIDEVLSTGQSSLPPPTDVLANLAHEAQVILTNHPVYKPLVNHWVNHWGRILSFDSAEKPPVF